MQIVQMLKRGNSYLLARVVDEDALNSDYIKHNFKIGEVYEYIVCSNYDGKEWDGGNYYGRDSLQGALDHVESGNKICYNRMSELATLFKDGLIEDDEENARAYFEEICEMDEDELEYFGLKGEE